MYYAILHSHYIFGIHIWSCTNFHNLNGLILNKKMAKRIVCQKKYNAHTGPLFKSTCILPLNMLIGYFQLQFIHKYLEGTLPRCFDNMWVQNQRRNEDDRMLLRNYHDIFTQQTRLVSSHVWG